MYAWCGVDRNRDIPILLPNSKKRKTRTFLATSSSYYLMIAILSLSVCFSVAAELRTALEALTRKEQEAKEKMRSESSFSGMFNK